MKRLLRNLTILTGCCSAPVIHGDILISGGMIEAVGENLSAEDAATENRSGDIAVPGFVNAHTHLAMTLFRGFAGGLPLMDWLQKIWAIEDVLTEEDVYWGSILGIAEMLRSGTACFADMYILMDKTAEAVSETGIRAALSIGMTGTDETALYKIENARRFFREWNGKADGRITVMYAPHAEYTTSPWFLKKTAEAALADGAGLHTHLAETQKEYDECIGRHGKSPYEVMRDAGILGPKTIAAHCVITNERDIEIMKETGAAAVSNPVSNMKLASGVSPMHRFRAAGVKTALGTDGASSNNTLDMHAEMKTFALVQKISACDANAIPSEEILMTATANGADALGINSGRIAAGMNADISIYDGSGISFAPGIEPLEQLIYSASRADLKETIVAGRTLYAGGEFKTLDAERAVYEVSRLMKRFYGGK